MPKRYQPWSEVEVAAPVVAWLHERGYEVWQEVSTGYTKPTCDIVARLGPTLIAVEVKTSFTLALLQQAHGWVSANAAHRVYVATPPTKRHVRCGLFCSSLQLGRLVVSRRDRGSHGDGVREASEAPRLTRRISTVLSKNLAEEQKTFCAAGSVSGAFTPWKRTCSYLRELVRSNPGVSLRDAAGRRGNADPPLRYGWVGAVVAGDPSEARRHPGCHDRR